MTTKPPSNAIAADLFLQALGDHGIGHFFANPGTDFPSIVEAFARARDSDVETPRPILVTHENVAVSMAHGASIVSGLPQAVMVHTNVGTGNAVNALTNASREHVPLLLVAGRSPVTQQGMHGARSFFIHWAQEMYDQAGMVRELVKWDYELRFPEQIEDVVDRAVEVATTAPQGPIYLTLPREALAQSAPAKREAAPRLGARPSIHPAAQDVAALADLIRAAKRPLIVTSNVGRSVEAFAALDRLAAEQGIGVAVPAQRYLALRTDHPMHLGFDGADHLPEADLVIVIEADVPWIPAGKHPRDDARIVHIGVDPSFTGIPMRAFPSDLSIAANADVLLAGLLDALAVAPSPAELTADRTTFWGERSKAWRDASAREEQEATQAERITPTLVARTLSKAIGEDALVFNEYSLPTRHLDRTKPATYFGLPSSGGLGWGLGAALGAKLAAPDKLVVATLGDGAYVFNNPTACHWVAEAHDLPVLTVIFNNALYGAVSYATAEMYHNGSSARDNWRMLADLRPSPAYELLAQASNGFGERVTDPAELEAAVARALHAVRVEGRQALLNVICS